MPVVNIFTNAILYHNCKKPLFQKISIIISDILNKPQKDVMVIMNRSEILFDNSDRASAYLEITCLSGLSIENNYKICENLKNCLFDYLRVDSERIYINFREANPECGWRFIDNIARCPASNMSIKIDQDKME